MVIFSWQEKWHNPTENKLNKLFMNMFMLISLSDAYTTTNPDIDLSPIDLLRKIREGTASPLGTRKTVSELKSLLPYGYVRTVENMYDIRPPTPLEICLQIKTMLHEPWYLYTTDSDIVPYILANDMGDYISPVELYDDETGDVSTLFAQPVDKVLDGDIIYTIFDSLPYINATNKNELISMYPNIATHIENAFAPGADVISIIENALKVPHSGIISLGEEIALVVSIYRIKCRTGANIILYS